MNDKKQLAEIRDTLDEAIRGQYGIEWDMVSSVITKLDAMLAEQHATSWAGDQICPVWRDKKCISKHCQHVGIHRWSSECALKPLNRDCSTCVPVDDKKGGANET